MDKKKIYNYVMNTPHNTNPNILKSLLNEPTSWNDLSDKPFYEETIMVGSDTLTWDGNTENVEYVSNGSIEYCLVSDATPTMSDFANGCITTVSTNGEESSVDWLPSDSGNCLVHDYFIIVFQENLSFGGYIFPKTGTYFFSVTLPNAPVTFATSLTINGYDGFKTTTTVVKPIETKYLPEHLQFGEEKAFEPISFVLDGNYAGVETTQLSNGHTYIKLYDKYVPETAVESLSLSMNGQTETINSGSIAADSHGWTASGFAASDGHESETLPEGVWVMDFFVTYKIPVTVSVIPKVTVKTLDEKYMPILTSPSGKKFKLSVDDSGVLSAVEV